MLIRNMKCFICYPCKLEKIYLLKMVLLTANVTNYDLKRHYILKDNSMQYQTIVTYGIQVNRLMRISNQRSHAREPGANH